MVELLCIVRGTRIGVTSRLSSAGQRGYRVSNQAKKQGGNNDVSKIWSGSFHSLNLPRRSCREAGFGAGTTTLLQPILTFEVKPVKRR